MDYLIVQLAEKQIDVAHFSFSGRQVALKGAQTFELHAEQTLESVAAVLASGITAGVKVVLSLHPALVAQRTVSLPLTDLRKVREVLPVHLQGECALPTDELVFDVLPAGHGNYLALWTKKQEVVRLISLFQSAGCDPQQITAAPFAWNMLPGVSADDALFDGTTLVLLAGGHVSLAVAFSGENRLQQLLTHLTALELSGSALPKRLLFFGEACSESCEAIDLPLPAGTLCLPDDLGGVFKNEENFQTLASLYAVAVAGHEGRLADFRRGELACRRDDSALRKKLFTTGLLAVIVVVLLFGSKIKQYRSVNTDLASLDSSITAIYRELFPGRKAIDEVAEIKGEIKKLSGAGASRSLLELCKKLADAKGTAVNGLLEVEMDGATVRIKGDAASAKGAADFSAALADVMQPAQLGETKSRPDGTVSFVITGSFREGK